MLKKYYFDKFTMAKDNINKIWKILQHLLNSEQNSKQSITEVHVGKLVITDTGNKIMSNTFNENFANVGINLAKKIFLQLWEMPQIT